MHTTSLLYLGPSPCGRACLEVSEGLLKLHRHLDLKRGVACCCAGAAHRSDLLLQPQQPHGSSGHQEAAGRAGGLCAQERRAHPLVYDAAYAIYIADSDLPQTIFEIPGLAAASLRARLCH